MTGTVRGDLNERDTGPLGHVTITAGERSFRFPVWARHEGRIGFGNGSASTVVEGTEIEVEGDDVTLAKAPAAARPVALKAAAELNAGREYEGTY